MTMHDPEFGAKLDALEMAVGWRFERRAFEGQAMADVLGVTPATVSRKRSGANTVNAGDWSRLNGRFLRGHEVTPWIWREPLAAFEAAMGRLYLDENARPEPDEARRTLHALSRRDRSRVALHLDVAPGGRRGGIGAPSPARSMPLLRGGDRVHLRVTMPGPGTLIVLNDEVPGDAITCLMPSSYAPDWIIGAGQVVVPTSINAEGFPVGPAEAPCDFLRVYAVWFRSPPGLAIRRLIGTKDLDPVRLDTAEFAQLASVAERVADAGEVAVAIADYQLDMRRF